MSREGVKMVDDRVTIDELPMVDNVIFRDEEKRRLDTTRC